MGICGGGGAARLTRFMQPCPAAPDTHDPLSDLQPTAWSVRGRCTRAQKRHGRTQSAQTRDAAASTSRGPPCAFQCAQSSLSSDVPVLMHTHAAMRRPPAPHPPTAARQQTRPGSCCRAWLIASHVCCALQRLRVRLCAGKPASAPAVAAAACCPVWLHAAHLEEGVQFQATLHACPCRRLGTLSPS